MATLEAPSGNTPPRSRAPMQLVAEKVAPDQTLSGLIAAQTTASSTPSDVPRGIPNAEYVHRAAWKAGVLASINVLAIVLAVRLGLLVAIVGAIGLTYIAIQTPDPLRLGALAIYCAFVLLPTTWLASRR
ncbi:MAG TPA: hypothetical protein VIH81_12770 [Roseiarcus sp.]